jgi:hypothetical protein
MPKFRKKPVVVEAIQWTGENTDEVEHFLQGFGYPQHRYVPIATLEGVMNADIGDWIIKGVKGEFYPCKPDIFHVTYELVDA